MATDPVASRLGLPGYGLPDDSPLLPWCDVNERLATALHYWLALTQSNGRPITRPIDGMWVNNCLYFSGDRESLWRRALEANPEASLHLEDGERTVIALRQRRCGYASMSSRCPVVRRQSRTKEWTTLRQ